MIPSLVVLAYLATVLYIGIFAFRMSRRTTAEDYFVAGRSLGPSVFLLSLFGTNMTAFSILGASGHAFANGIVTYGLMASSSALVLGFLPVVPMTLISGLLMVVVSLATLPVSKPGTATLARCF